jgi:predicted RNase H-like HicB family nuclease
MAEYTVTIVWDNEARVWIAESKDIPGLILESGSVDALIERVKIAALELLELSGKTVHNVGLNIKAERLVLAA